MFGASPSSDNSIVPPGDALYVLDLTTFTWYIPNTSGRTPNSRVNHQANLVGNYVVVSFGKYIFYVDFLATRPTRRHYRIT